MSNPTLHFTLSPSSTQRIHESLITLSKFSESISLEARRGILILSALNSTKTASAAIHLTTNRFCITYNFSSSTDTDRFQCRLSARALLSVFRQRFLDSRDKSTAISKCEVQLEQQGPENRIAVRLLCNHGVVKTYKLTYEDVEILHAVFNRDTATARWRLGSSLLKEYMEHFSAKAEKLAISSAASEGRATFTSFTEKLVDGKDTLKQPLHTNVSLDIGNFEEFSVDDGVRVGVSLKDFTAVAWFAAILETMVEARYSVPGRAMQVAYAKDGLEAVYTLMTAQDNRISQSFGGPGSQMGRVVAVQRREPVETREETPRREMIERQESGRPPTERLESVRPSGSESTAGTIHQPTPRRETPASLAPQQNFSYRPTQQLPPMPPTPPPPPQTAPLFLYGEDEDEMDDSDREHNLFGEMDQERGSFTLGWDTTYAGNAEKGEKAVNKKKRGRNTVEDEDDDSDGDFVMPTQQPRPKGLFD